MSTRNQLILIRSCSFAVALKRALKIKQHLYSTKCLPHTILLTVGLYTSNVFQPTENNLFCVYIRLQRARASEYWALCACNSRL